MATATADKAKALKEKDRVRALSGDWGKGNLGTVKSVEGKDITVKMDAGQEATFRANALEAQ